MRGQKLFYVAGIRHHAIVIAQNGSEAVQLALKASQGKKANPRVLYGGVQDWEAPTAQGLRLPKNYELIVKRTRPPR